MRSITSHTQSLSWEIKLPEMGQKLSIMVSVLHGANINSFSKIFDADGNGEFFQGSYNIKE